MPTRSRQSTSRAVTQPEQEDGAYNVGGLEYNEPLSWRAGKPIAVADLFTRLQKLSNELRNKEPTDVEVKDLTKLAQDLVHPNLLGHKDKGIRAWTLCCIVDILNICAPNAPYRPNQLKDIFTVIVNTILPALTDPSNAYNAQHQYILDQLVDAQSIVLITDIQDSESLINQLFTNAFDVVSGSVKNSSGLELAQSVVFQITMMLNSIIDEANLPQEVVDIIISQFLRVDPRTNQPGPTKKKNAAKDKTQSTLVLKDYPPAYNLAKSVCTACSEKMSAAVSQYFSAIITNASSALADDDNVRTKLSKRPLSPDSDSDDDDHESLNDLRKAHRLVRELWRACPDVLTNVIPQLEVELAADSTSLRQLAVETIGDLVAGIGIAGLPDLPVLDPAAFPLPTIDDTENIALSNNPLQKPSAPKPFIHVYSSTYQAFLGRRIDKAVSVRAAWANAAGRVLLTRAGGTGLNADELSILVSAQTKMLKDIDEKVRLSALQSLNLFPYQTVVEILGSDGGLSQPSSLFSIIAERITDRKVAVRDQAMVLLGNMWGVASQDISNNNDRVRSMLGLAPTKVLSAMYVKDAHVGAMLSKVLYENLLPLGYPPVKGKVTVSQSEADGDVSESVVDPDTLRVKRLLTLVRDLDERAKPVFFALQKRQADLSKGIMTFLRACEDYNGGVADDAAEEKRLEDQLTRFIDSLSRQLPDPTKASSDLWKFAKAHDRRSYQLIRFAMGPEHDYRTMTKAIKEFHKRMTDGGAATVATMDTLRMMLNQCALVSYNRSHIPAIMDYAKSSDGSLAETAQEVLGEISEKVPEVMKTHIQVLCRELEEGAPLENSPESPSAADSLKACATFAKSFPNEVPNNRKFIVAMQNFINYSSSSKAAKHAASIVLLSSDKKEFHAKAILSKAIQRFNSGSENLSAQLAAIAQVCLLAPSVASEATLPEIATKALQKVASKEIGWDQNAWSDNIDQETEVKQLALKIHVNRCRSSPVRDSDEEFVDLASFTINLLMSVIETEGDITKTNNVTSVQRNHLRLTAARYLLKLCRHRQRCEELVTAPQFHTVAWMLVSPPYGVRGGLVGQLKKYFSQNRLSSRWLTLLFLLPFEPDDELRNSTTSWLKSRAAFYARQQKQVRTDKKASAQNIMELTFARLLSLLAHHPDFPITGETDYDGQLLDFAKYIIFYLQCTATEDNLSLIFHVAQRVKQTSDAVSNDSDTDARLYILSDLAQATIRNYAEQMPNSTKGMNLLQTWPGKAHLPNSLFKPINGHVRAQEVAAKNYIPEEVALGLETLVRKSIRIGRQGAKSKSTPSEKKRKSSVSIDLDDEDQDATIKSVKKGRSSKRTATSLPIRKTPNSKKRKTEHVMTVEQPSRKSVRTSTATKVNYEESDEGESNEEEEDKEKEEGSSPENISAKPLPGKTQQKNARSGRKAGSIVVQAEDKADNEDTLPEMVEASGSPTPHARNGPASSDVEVEDAPNDAEMMNGHEDEEQGDSVEEEEAEASLPPRQNPHATRPKRATSTKSTPVSSRKSKATPKTKVAVASSQDSLATSRTKSARKADGKNRTSPALEKRKADASSPIVEPVRRSARRTNA